MFNGLENTCFFVNFAQVSKDLMYNGLVDNIPVYLFLFF